MSFMEEIALGSTKYFAIYNLILIEKYNFNRSVRKLFSSVIWRCS